MELETLIGLLILNAIFGIALFETVLLDLLPLIKLSDDVHNKYPPF
jgi:hypothetical protein